MPTDLLEPDRGNPPRTLYEWTRVEGHEVAGVERGRARCVCGESQPVHNLLRPRVGAARRDLTVGEGAEVRATARAWRDEHLRTTWPILVSRLEDETLEDHAHRVGEELAEARVHRDRLDHEMDGSDDSIPVLSEEQTDAGVRAAVLKNQYNELCKRLHRKHLIEGSDEQAYWMVEGYGDPLDEI